MTRLALVLTLFPMLALALGEERGFPGAFGTGKGFPVRPSAAAASVPADFFTYGLSAPAAGAQCTNALITSDQSDAITCTRASTAYCTKGDGTMVLHSNNRCRVEADGALSEGARTNYAFRSMELQNNVVWPVFQSTVTGTNVGVFPDGLTTMEEVATSPASGQLYQQVTVPSGVGPFTYSMYVGKSSGTGPSTISLYCNGISISACACRRKSGGACTIYGLNSPTLGMCRAKMTASTTIDRMEITATCATPTTSVHIQVTGGEYAVTAASSLFGGGQLELAASASSYIHTDGTATARAADAITTALTQSVDTSGCMGATVTYGPVFPGALDWLMLDGAGELFVDDATSIAFSDQIGANTITVPSMLSTTTTGRAYWSGIVQGVASGATSDEGAFAGSAAPTGVLTIGGPTTNFVHIRGIRVNTDPGGCQ